MFNIFTTLVCRRRWLFFLLFLFMQIWLHHHSNVSLGRTERNAGRKASRKVEWLPLDFFSVLRLLSSPEGIPLYTRRFIKNAERSISNSSFQCQSPSKPKMNAHECTCEWCKRNLQPFCVYDGNWNVLWDEKKERFMSKVRNCGRSLLSKKWTLVGGKKFASLSSSH